MESQVTTKNTFLREAESMRDLRVLEEIERDSSLSQREVADKLGVAVGIVNSCIHTLVRKGLVKVRGENNRSITYHLTKKGLLHKSRLAVEWTMNTIDFYRDARTKVARRIAALGSSGVSRVALYGANELAEIALIVSGEAVVTITAVIGEPGTQRRALVNLPVVGVAEALVSKPQAIVATVPVPEDVVRTFAEAGLPVYDLSGTSAWPFEMVGSDAR